MKLARAGTFLSKRSRDNELRAEGDIVLINGKASMTVD
jgi:hypothetical protein